MYVCEKDILTAEHRLLIEAVDANNPSGDFTSGYITGIVALASALTEEMGGE